MQKPSNFPIKSTDENQDFQNPNRPLPQILSNPHLQTPQFIHKNRSQAQPRNGSKTDLR